MFRQAAWSTVILASMASLCAAETISVRRDGAGDYAVLQAALDAAADGDTILVGPGEYLETTTVHPPGWPGDLEVYGEIRQQHLVIIGAGRDVTFIGPSASAPNYSAESPEGLATDAPKESLTIRDLTVRNCFKGIAVSCSLQLESCNIENNLFGLSWTARGAGGVVRDCAFSTTDALEPLGLYVRGVAGVVVEDCQFTRARPCVDNLAAVIRQCMIVGPDVIGLQAASGMCQLWNCQISGVQAGVRTEYIGAQCEIYDSEIQGSFCAVDVEHRTQMSVERSTLTGGTDAVVYSYDAEDIDIHGSDLVRGSGHVVHCARNCALGSAIYDLSGNYWGTTDEAQIQEWIVDSNDNASICATVLYSPFAGQSVPTESTTWGDLKALFR